MTPLLPAFVGSPQVNTVYNVDALTLLRALPDNSIDCCVTSPPYFGLRDYGVAGQIGLEKTPAEYVQTLVTLFREVRRVLKDSGTFWLNLGDSYWGGKGQSGGASPERQAERNAAGMSLNRSYQQLTGAKKTRPTDMKPDVYQSKDLMLIPHRVAIALQDDGWIVRQDNVWHKPNPMPESVTDRTTRAHEYVFQFAKSARYYYNAEAVREESIINPNWNEPSNKYHVQKHGNGETSRSQKFGRVGKFGEGRNKRSVWTIPPAQFREAHFATFPLELPEICIRAGCPRGGVVLDPFMGSGTVALVARAEGCDYIGSELNSEYITIARRRLAQPFTPMFAELAG